jgi:hypothetical protein
MTKVVLPELENEIGQHSKKNRIPGFYTRGKWLDPCIKGSVYHHKRKKSFLNPWLLLSLEIYLPSLSSDFGFSITPEKINSVSPASPLAPGFMPCNKQTQSRKPPSSIITEDTL